MASRLQVADYLTDHLNDPRLRKNAVRAAAAWLVKTRRTRQTEYLARDVASALVNQGYLLVRITTARPLLPAAWENVVNYMMALTKAKIIELDKVVDPELIGGVIIETPSSVLDASVRTKLARYVERVCDERQA